MIKSLFNIPYSGTNFYYILGITLLFSAIRMLLDYFKPSKEEKRTQGWLFCAITYTFLGVCFLLLQDQLPILALNNYIIAIIVVIVVVVMFGSGEVVDYISLQKQRKREKRRE